METKPSQQRLRVLARRVGLREAVRTLAGAFGYQLLRKHYYSPVPDLAAIPGEAWTRQSELSGLRFPADGGLDFMRHELARHVAEYRPPRGPTGNPRDFYLDNSLYGDGDAHTLYAMIRSFAPRRIVELGSGMSTLVIADARARNAQRAGDRHRVFDPFPDPALAGVLERVCELHATPATNVSLTEFTELCSGDLLFVDTTHTVKLNSDVNRVILDVLPILSPGVLVHFHDIFLPWEYPREFLAERNFFWAEQYLLQAFLAFNGAFEILFSANAVQRTHPKDLAGLIPGLACDARPSALWLRSVEP